MASAGMLEEHSSKNPHRPRKKGAGCEVSVSDTGIGLAPEERIFQRFYRAPAAVSKGEEGAGLGLCIAHSIAEAHGGSIQVESAEGHGSTFTVFLPR